MGKLICKWAIFNSLTELTGTQVSTQGVEPEGREEWSVVCHGRGNLGPAVSISCPSPWTGDQGYIVDIEMRIQHYNIYIYTYLNYIH